LDAYQSGAIELSERQKRRHLVDTKLNMLQREKELLEKTAAEQRKEADLIASLEQFATTISGAGCISCAQRRDRVSRRVAVWSVTLCVGGGPNPLPRMVHLSSSEGSR